jgi:hypothetical protein
VSGAGTKSWDRTGGVAQDRRWFPTGYAISRDEWTFTRTDNVALTAQPFLDSRWDRQKLSQARVKTAALVDALPDIAVPRLNFIWHTGFCCSTLIAQALNSGAKSLALCEPEVFAHIAFAERGLHGKAGDLPALKRLGFHFLGRTPAPVEAVTIKPAPAANRLLPDAAHSTRGKMLFLYSDCRSFLLSIRKLGPDGAGYVRQMFRALAADGCAPATTPNLNDLELAALVWQMQIAQMRAHWPKGGASLDCDAFLADMPGAMTKIASFLELDLHAEDFRALAGQGFFSRNAKERGNAHDADARRREHGALADQLGNELDRVVRWSYELFPATPRGAPLDESLITIEKAYLS